jgi:hypothetical protein
MSWGYFVELNLTLPAATLAALKKKKPADVALPVGWSGLRDAGLETAFGRRLTTRETFARTLKWFDATPSLPALQREEAVGESTSLRVLTMLEKSVLDHAFPLAALFHAARETGGTGTLRFLHDGTSNGEAGVELTLANGEIVARRLDEEWERVGQLGEELFAKREHATTKTPKSARGATPKTAPKGTHPARAKSASAPAGGVVFTRFVDEGLAWLGGRDIETILALVDGERTDSSMGQLGYIQYRRAIATGAAASATDPAVRLALTARAGKLRQIVLAVPFDAPEFVRFSEPELTQLGEAWKAGVVSLAKRLGLERVARPGTGTDKRAFRGEVEGSRLELEWSRTGHLVAGKICVGYLVVAQRL